MTRSDMIECISNFLEKEDLESIQLGFNQKVLAEDILNMIENLGMLPLPLDSEHVDIPVAIHYNNMWDEE